MTPEEHKKLQSMVFRAVATYWGWKGQWVVEELVLNTMLELCRNPIPLFDGNGGFSPEAFRTMRFACIRELNRLTKGRNKYRPKHTISLDEKNYPIADEAPSPEEIVAGREALAKLIDSNMSEREAQVLMGLLAGKTQRQIWQEIGSSESYVNACVATLRNKLAKIRRN